MKRVKDGRSYFFMTRKRVRLLPRPAGLSLAGSTSGYSSWAPGSNGTSAVKARHTLITLGCADNLLGSTPKCLHVEKSKSFMGNRRTSNELRKHWRNNRYPSRVICSFSCFKAWGPAGTSSCDMDVNIASLDEHACKQMALKNPCQYWFFPHRKD